MVWWADRPSASMASSPASAASAPASSSNHALLLAHAATATVSALSAATITWLWMRRRGALASSSEVRAAAEARARMLALADASCTAEHGMTPSEFNAAAHALVDQITEYRSTLRCRPVKARVEPGYLAALVPARAPEEGEPWADIQADIERVIMPGLTHWGSPRFMAYFPAFASYPSLLGEMLCSAANTIGFSWVGSPASTELETRCLDWVAQLLDLPPEFTHQQGQGGGGCLQGTAAEAGAVAMLAGKVSSYLSLSRTSSRFLLPLMPLHSESSLTVSLSLLPSRCCFCLYACRPRLWSSFDHRTVMWI